MPHGIQGRADGSLSPLSIFSVARAAEVIRSVQLRVLGQTGFG